VPGTRATNGSWGGSGGRRLGTPPIARRELERLVGPERVERVDRVEREESVLGVRPERDEALAAGAGAALAGVGVAAGAAAAPRGARPQELQ
jgi:hypothetical protein